MGSLPTVPSADVTNLAQQQSELVNLCRQMGWKLEFLNDDSAMLTGQDGVMYHLWRTHRPAFMRFVRAGYGKAGEPFANRETLKHFLISELAWMGFDAKGTIGLVMYPH